MDKKVSKVNIVWFRRDMRLHDNAALFHALKEGLPVVPVFIFDRNILDDLEDEKDPRVEFIRLALVRLQEQLAALGSTLDVRHGYPGEIWEEITADYPVKAVFTNNDYEPYARHRDQKVCDLLKAKGIAFQSFKDQVVFEKDEVIKEDDKPYTVFTPYSKKWKARLNSSYLSSYPAEKYFSNIYRQSERQIPELEQLHFKPSGIDFPRSGWTSTLLKNYKERRDFPGVAGTSRLSVHLRFGTISIRELAREANKLSESFLNELIWRDFYQMILWHFPHIVDRAFKPEYDRIRWRNNEKEFEAWCHGQTGYPIVDAGMRELNATGYMHNRVRMIVASFLTKHLLTDWRKGEAYFAKKLLDYDLAANNGGWQWAAGSGCDAAPYFRIFNPYLQAKKFDPDRVYIHKWVPELDTPHYPPPIIDHETARKRCLDAYSIALRKQPV